MLLLQYVRDIPRINKELYWEYHAMFINEIITCGNDALYILAVEMFVVEQSVNVDIYLCVYSSLILDVCGCGCSRVF